MRHFPSLRTKRLNVQLQEISIGDSIEVAAMPVHLEQAECTAFLRSVVKSSTIEEPATWTVQERMLAVAHYLASVLDDGPDFPLGAGHYSDYLDGMADNCLENYHLGQIGDDDWSMSHLTGGMAEAIERLEGELKVPSRMHWILGCMAAQLVRSGEENPDPASGQYDEWLLNRMRIISSYPESDFEQLMIAFYAGREQLHHLFRIDFGIDGGLVALPKGGAGELPPARFQVRSGLSPFALSMVRQYD
jgi:hypothetical protein